MYARAGAIVFVLFAGTVSTHHAYAVRVTEVEITLDAKVTQVIGGGSFTMTTPEGGTIVRNYRVSEIPNFYWKPGNALRLSWVLSPQELDFQYALHCPSQQFPFLGASPPQDFGVCDGKPSIDRPFEDVYESDPPAATGPSVDLETGVVTRFYAPRTLWTTDYCCAYLYDAVTDRFVTGGSANLPRSDNMPFYSEGEIGAKRGEFLYTFAVDPLGTDTRDFGRPAFEVSTARVIFAPEWHVDIRVIDEPASAGLVSLALALVLARAGASGRWLVRRTGVLPVPVSLPA